MTQSGQLDAMLGGRHWGRVLKDEHGLANTTSSSASAHPNVTPLVLSEHLVFSVTAFLPFVMSVVASHWL